MKGSGSAPGLALDRDLTLLHRLEQRRLGLGGVRLISSASSRFVNTGPSRNRKSPAAPGGLALAEDHLTDDIGRHQVGRELHPSEVEVEGRGQGLGEQRLGHPRHALEQHMAVDEQRGDEAGQRPLLADDHLADLLPHGQDGGPRIGGAGLRQWKTSRWTDATARATATSSSSVDTA